MAILTGSSTLMFAAGQPLASGSCEGLPVGLPAAGSRGSAFIPTEEASISRCSPFRMPFFSRYEDRVYGGNGGSTVTSSDILIAKHQLMDELEAIAFAPDERECNLRWGNVQKLFRREIVLCRMFWEELEHCLEAYSKPDALSPEIYREQHIRAELAESLAGYLIAHPHTRCKPLVRHENVRADLWDQAVFILQAKVSDGKLEWPALKEIMSVE
jgi:hypothetical protein